MSDCAWILDGVTQFVRSPMWTAPVNNFVDEKCIFFDSNAEMKLEYTPIHHEFQELVDGLLTTYISELGVPMEDALNAIKASEHPTHKQLVEYLIYLDDFVSFKKLMEKRNVELELEALRELEKKNITLTGGEGAEVPEGEVNDEEWVAAIRASELEANMIMKEAEMEDLELQRALALSIVSEHERQQREAAAKAEHERAAAEEAALKDRQAMEEQNMEARKKNLETAQAKVREVEARAPVQRTPPPTPPIETAVAIDSKPAPASATQPQDDPNAPAVVRITAHHAPAAGGKLPALAPIGRSGAFGASKPLPSIQKTFKQLQEESSTTPQQQPPTLPSASSVPPKPEAKQEVSMEQFKARQEEIRRQRDMLLAMKKQQRNDELVQAGGAPANESPSANLTDEDSKKLTIEIARRFREDIVQESRK